MDNEPFSNPIAPANFESKEDRLIDTQPLTNDDFRKLLMTPRVSNSNLSSSKLDYASSVRGGRKPILKPDDENRKKKKKLCAAIKKQEKDVLAELAKKYRDRAKERRSGANPDYQSEDSNNAMAAYRAVAPDLKATVNAAERRKQMIEESKFLGGDMKHTHLVKGLDYALLHKVKAELMEQEKDELEESEELEKEKEQKAQVQSVKVDQTDSTWSVKSKMVKNMLSILNESKQGSTKNELFLPHRMAYIVDLEDECADEIPTTVIRSKDDCPNCDSSSLLSTNDIVINKLIEILSYLRQSGGSRKKRKDKLSGTSSTLSSKQVDEIEAKKPKSKQVDNIYEDIGEYIPPHERKDKKSRHHHHHHHHRHHHRERNDRY